MHILDSSPWDVMRNNVKETVLAESIVALEYMSWLSSEGFSLKHLFIQQIGIICTLYDP